MLHTNNKYIGKHSSNYHNKDHYVKLIWKNARDYYTNIRNESDEQKQLVYNKLEKLQVSLYQLTVTAKSRITVQAADRVTYELPPNISGLVKTRPGSSSKTDDNTIASTSRKRQEVLGIDPRHRIC